MIMNRIYLALILVAILFQGVIAQNKHLDKAEILFDSRDYVGAVKLFRKALRNTDNINEKQQIAAKIALAYYYMNDYSNASSWFEDAIGDNSTNIETYLYYSQSLLVQKRFGEASDVLDRAGEAYPGNYEIELRADAVKSIINNQFFDERTVIQKVESLSGDDSDYGIGYWNNLLVFSSTRANGSQKVDGRTGQGYSNLYVADIDYDGFSNIKYLSNRINSPLNDGTFAFDHLNSQGFWTVCSGKPGSCKIYFADYSNNKGWSKPEKVSFMSSGYSYAHPFISNDGNTMYFTSNMSGGYGGNDIWKVTRKDDGLWGVPINLGDNINTSANEMFPSLFNDTILFFASNNITSYGGLDIYFSMKNGIGYTEAINVGLPVNSAADDFNLLMKNDGSGGYLCSNRDFETSDDIYYFPGFPVKINLSGIVLRESDKMPVNMADIIIIDDRKNDTVRTDENGNYSFLLDAYNRYRIIANKTGFYRDEKVINTKDDMYLLSGVNEIYVDFSLVKKIYICGISGIVTEKESGKPMGNILVGIESNEGFSSFTYTDSDGKYLFDGLKPMTIYSVKTGKAGYFSESRVCKLPKIHKDMIFSKESGYDMDFQLLKIQKEKEITLSDIYYDYNKASLREESKVELDKLASMLKETPKVVVQISSHTDSRGRDEYNMELSARRAASVVNYLVDKGISRDRLRAIGYGESKLLIENAITEEEHQSNRRTTFLVTGDDYSIWSESDDTKNLKYNVQLLTSSRKRDVDSDFDGITSKLGSVEIFEVETAGLYKYEAGSRNNFSDARILMKKIRLMGYRDCFIVSYFDDVKIPVSEALKIEGGQ